jgi:hypothetical protein
MHWYIFVHWKYRYSWAAKECDRWGLYLSLRTSFNQVSKRAKFVGQNKYIENVHITTNKNWKP